MKETPWLKRKTPPPGPPTPASVNLDVLNAKLEEARRLMIETPAQAYLSIKKPVQPMDQWGQTLPISAMEQDYLDRVFAVLADPLGRGRALLHSGRLSPDEVEPIVVVYPEVYAVMVELAIADMRDHPPPYPAWSESVLGVLFQKPASAVYTGGTQAMGNPPSKQLTPPDATPGERRELAVRE